MLKASKSKQVDVEEVTQPRAEVPLRPIETPVLDPGPEAPAVPTEHPRVGRIVHYGVPAQAAIVTSVGELGLVSLVAFPPQGLAQSVDSVPYADNGKDGCWTWPPK